MIKEYIRNQLIEDKLADELNMKDAIAHGNRLIMMNEGKIILDIKGEEKKSLTVEHLLHMFEKVSGEEFASDKAILG